MLLELHSICTTSEAEWSVGEVIEMSESWDLTLTYLIERSKFGQ